MDEKKPKKGLVAALIAAPILLAVIAVALVALKTAGVIG